MIRAVLFDYGGVLTQGGKRGSIARLVSKTLEVPVAELTPMGPLVKQLVLGQITTTLFLHQLSLAYPTAVRPTRTKLLANADIFIASQPVYELAELLRAQGVKTGILSNMFELSAVQLRKKGFYDGFNPVLLSCEEHLAKPDPLFYERAVVALGVQPHEIIFIDDQEQYRAPAEFLGMHFILAESPEQIVADVEALIFKCDGVRPR